MNKGRRTRREIIQKAAPLLNQQGYAGTSLSDLMQATGLRKGGIYRHFSSKQQLAAQVFDYSWDKAFRERLDGLDQLPDCVDRLKKMTGNFIELREGLVPGGCPLMNTAVESDDGNPVLRSRARKALQAWTSRIIAIATEGIRKRQIDSRVDPQELAQLIIGGLEGALLLSRLQNSGRPLRTVQRHLEQHLEAAVRARKRRKADVGA